MYIPKNRIKTNLYTRGNEYKKLSDGEEYIAIENVDSLKKLNNSSDEKIDNKDSAFKDLYVAKFVDAETNLIKVCPIPNPVKLTNRSIVERARLYNPKSSGIKILAKIITKIIPPTFSTIVVAELYMLFFIARPV